MDKIYKLILERLAAKKEDLAQRQDYFQVMTANEIHTSCFEQNAINALLTMQQVKAEIEELEHWEMLLRIQIQQKESGAA